MQRCFSGTKMFAHGSKGSALLFCAALTLTLSSITAAPVTVTASITSFQMDLPGTSVPYTLGALGGYRITANGQTVQFSPGSGVSSFTYFPSGSSVNWNLYQFQCTPPSPSCNPGTDIRTFPFLPPPDSWGSPGPSLPFSMIPELANQIVFNPAAGIDVSGVGPANKFKLATITYVNGTSHVTPTYVYFTLSTSSPDPAFNNQVFSGRLNLQINTNTGTPAEAADYFTVDDTGRNTIQALGSVRVYDQGFCPPGFGSNCNIGSVDLYGYFGSLHLSNFDNPTGGAFLDSSTSAPLASIPEPATLGVTALGLMIATVARVCRRR